MNFNTEEKNTIFELAERLTGAHQQGNYRRDILLTNISRRMNFQKVSTLTEYLNIALQNKQEYQFLVSALTIHTTSWFRELPHYKDFQAKLAKTDLKKYNVSNPFKLWCAASSTGEEVYSFAFVLETFRKQNPTFEYQIHATDIDQISIAKAKSGVYSKLCLNDIPREYHTFCWPGEGHTEKLFAIDSEIRKRIQFVAENINSFQSSQFRADWKNFDWIVCRNVLIYFKPEDVKKIIKSLSDRLAYDAILCLGHSEAIEARKFNLTLLGRSIYSKTSSQIQTDQAVKDRLLVIDDSETIRSVFIKNLSAHFDLTTCGSAEEADRVLMEKSFDLISLDLHMPGKNGITWLKEVRNRGFRTPIVIVSEADPNEAMSVLGALEKGAQDYIEKSKLIQDAEKSLIYFKEIILSFKEKNSKDKKNKEVTSIRGYHTKRNRIVDVILIGASTGGTEALATLLKNTPSFSPPIVVVQHISTQFTKAFAQRLASSSGLILGDCRQGEPLKAGHIYLALGDYHIGIQSVKGQPVLSVSTSAEVNGHRPSVDYMYRTASLMPANFLVILLTGMGKDGARGMLELHKKGALTFAQDEQSCVVFGMPKEAIKLGAVDFVGSLTEIRTALMDSISKAKNKKTNAA